ncbi:MAG: hypothetical protein OEM52_07310 [bacterium]|nr:hypothetical protein [bacterium]
MNLFPIVIGTISAIGATILFAFILSFFAKRLRKEFTARSKADLECDIRAVSVTLYFSVAYVSLALPSIVKSEIGVWQGEVYAIMMALVFFSARWYYRQKAKKHPDTLPLTNSR